MTLPTEPSPSSFAEGHEGAPPPPSSSPLPPSPSSPAAAATPASASGPLPAPAPTSTPTATAPTPSSAPSSAPSSTAAPTASGATASPATAGTVPPGVLAARVRWLSIGFALAVVAALAAAWLAVGGLREQQARVADLAAQLDAQRAALAAAEARRQSLDEQVDTLAAELAAAQEQASTAAAAGDPARLREDITLLEAERLIGFAQQELQLGGSVSAALAALQSADAGVARLQRAQLLPLRRALAADLEKVRAMPVVDTVGESLRLDELARGIDSWPALADANRALLPDPPARRTGEAAPGKAASGADPRADAKAAPRMPPPAAQGAASGSAVAEGVAAGPAWWAATRAWLAREFGDLVQVRHVATPQALLLDPAQVALLRERLRLRLLTARQALLTRNERLLHAEALQCLALLERYFDGRSAPVAAAAAELRALATLSLGGPTPATLDSPAAIRAVTLPPTAPAGGAAAATPTGAGAVPARR